MCLACDSFRKFTLSADHKESAVLCRQCDDHHALLVHHLASHGWDDGEKEQYLLRHPLTQADEHDIPTDNIVIRSMENGGRHYIEYNCPYLGFRETLFPILLEGRLVGTLFEGQIILDDGEHVTQIKERTETLLDRFPHCFDAYCTQTGCTREHLLEQLVGHVTNLVAGEAANGPESPDQSPRQHSHWSKVRSVEGYQNLIRDADRSLVVLENILQTELGSQRRVRVREVVSEATSHIDQLGTMGNNEAENVGAARDALRNVMSCLRERFSLRYAVMFASLAPLESASLTPLAVSCPEGGDLKNSLEKLQIDMADMPDHMTYKVVLSDFPESPLLKRLQCPETSNLGHFALISIPLHFRGASPPYFLFGLPDAFPLLSPENTPRHAGEQLTDNDFYGSLQPLFTLIGSFIASAIASATATIESHELQYLSHELSQQCDGLDNIRLRYMTKWDRLKNITQKKAEDLNRNVEAYLKQLRNIMEFAKKLARDESLVAKPTSFWPFGEIIGKWLDVFYMQRQEKKMTLDYPKVQGSDDPLRPKISADERLFEMLLYNLLNNAEKYGYRGTRIYLDLALETKDDQPPQPEAPYVLTITDYGAAPDGNIQMFEAFTKTDKAEGGLGVGLYLARLIMTAHHGSIDFEPRRGEKISDYNVPLLGPAVRMGESVFKDKVYRSELEVEYMRLKSNGMYDHVVSHKNVLDSEGKPILDECTKKFKRTEMHDPFKNTIRAEIGKPTYRATIVARFPRKED